MVSTITRSFSFSALAGAICSLSTPCPALGQAQSDTSTLNVTAYADAYYAAFTGDYAAGEVTEFETMSSRANILGLNAVGVAAAYEADRIRANAEVFFGEVSDLAWGGSRIKNANAGVRVAKDFWIDAGFFSTYVGVESALPKDNVFSSVAVSTYQEPYFHAAARAAYSGLEGFDFELWLGNQYNGYGENNKAKTIGAVVRYAINDEFTVSYTGTYGQELRQGLVDTLDALGANKPFNLYSNLNLVATPTERLEILVNGSIATSTNSTGENGEDALSGVNGMATLRYLVSDRLAVAARGSFLTGDAYLSTNDFGLSLQLTPLDDSYVRLEGRTIGSDTDVFTDNDNDPTDRRFDLVLSMGVSLGRDWSFARE